MALSRRIFRLCSAILAMAACTVDSEDGPGLTFGPTTNPTSFTTSMTATTADPSSSTTDDVSTSGDDPTSDGEVDDSDSEAGTSAASTSGETGGPIEQPESGMYSHCTSVAQCVGLNLCVVVAVDDGFCSTTPCTDAASCDATPGGTATPTCVEVTVNMAMSTACALDCSGGKTCPGGMICTALGAGMVCT